MFYVLRPAFCGFLSLRRGGGGGRVDHRPNLGYNQVRLNDVGGEGGAPCFQLATV